MPYPVSKMLSSIRQATSKIPHHPYSHQVRNVTMTPFIELTSELQRGQAMCPSQQETRIVTQASGPSLYKSLLIVCDISGRQGSLSHFSDGKLTLHEDKEQAPDHTARQEMVLSHPT